MNPRLLLPRFPRIARSLPRAAQARIHTTRPRAARRTVPHVGACPEPSCPCEPPPELDIDRKGVLRGLFVPYNEHVLVCTGRDDWVSRVEDEEGVAGDVVRRLKGDLGRKGQFHNVSLPPWLLYKPCCCCYSLPCRTRTRSLEADKTSRIATSPSWQPPSPARTRTRLSTSSPPSSTSPLYHQTPAPSPPSRKHISSPKASLPT